MMRRMMLLLFLGILAFGDGGFFWQDPYAELEKADQLAFVYYEKQRETLILSISYKGKAGNFAWVIPLPSLPEVSLAPKYFFPQLGELLYSLHQPVHQGGGEAGLAGFAGGEEVEVISRQKIGVYDISVLSSTDPAALYNWCKKEGYNLPEVAPLLLKPYIEAKWYFVTVKISQGRGAKETSVEGELAPLRLEFSSGTILYPLRISSLNREYIDPKIRKIDVWLGHKVVFRKEWEEIAKKIIGQTEEDRRKAIPFEETLLYKLGFAELGKSYEKSLNGQMEDRDFSLLINMVINDILEALADKEMIGLELIAVAPYPLTIGKQTPKTVSDYLDITFTSQLEPELLRSYLIDEKGTPLFQPSETMYLTHIVGRIPLSLLTRDLYLLQK